MSNLVKHNPAVIVGMEENGLGVARSLAKENIPIIGLATPTWNPCCQTKMAQIVHCREWNHESVVTELIKIGQKLNSKASLLITKDEPVLWISKDRDKLSEYFDIALPEDKVVNLLMDKQKFKEMAVAEKWPYPKTWNVNNLNELQNTQHDIDYPCIVKPAVKNNLFRKYTPRKAFKVFDAQELIKIYNFISQWEKEVVIQEWIEGDDDHVAFCLTYYNKRHKPLSLFAGRKLRQYPIECGNTALCEPAPKNWAQSLINLTEVIFNKVDYVGLGSVEFKMRRVNNDFIPYIMEPTVGRTNYQNEIAVLNGQNIPAIAFYDMAYNQQHKAFSTLKRCKLVDGKNEIKASFEYFKQNRLTFYKWLSDRRGKKSYMLFRFSDFSPALAYIKITLLRIIRKIFKIIFGYRS